MGFLDKIVSWMNMLNCEYHCKIKGETTLSRTFITEKGCQQGAPWSSILFIFVAQCLSTQLKKMGSYLFAQADIFQDGSCKTFNQFAVDTVLWCDSNKKKLYNLLSIVKKFSKVSGLEINFEKTKATMMGKVNIEKYKILKKTFPELVWDQGKIETLGFVIGEEKYQIEFVNNVFEKALEKMWSHKEVALTWSFKERIVFCNSYILSKIRYVCSTMPVSDKICQNFDEQVKKFCKPPSGVKNLYRKRLKGGWGLL